MDLAEFLAGSVFEALPKLLDLFTVMLAPLALFSVSVGSVRRMIALYRVQSLMLTLLTVLSATYLAIRDNNPLNLVLLIFAIFPLVLAFIIKRVLAEATVPPDQSKPREKRLWYVVEQDLPSALLIWLQWGLSTKRQALSALAAFVLSGLSVITALKLNMVEPGAANVPNGTLGFAVALALLLLGIFTMITRADLISQVIGLLVMDHGIYLSVVRLIRLPQLIPIFVTSLFAYIGITLLILLYLVREVHRMSGTIGVAGQRALNDAGDFATQFGVKKYSSSVEPSDGKNETQAVHAGVPSQEPSTVAEQDLKVI